MKFSRFANNFRDEKADALEGTSGLTAASPAVPGAHTPRVLQPAAKRLFRQGFANSHVMNNYRNTARPDMTTSRIEKPAGSTAARAERTAPAPQFRRNGP